MSSSYINQAFQTNHQFDRNRTPLQSARPRVETPIFPPQIPPHSSYQLQQQPQQQQTQSQPDQDGGFYHRAGDPLPVRIPPHLQYQLGSTVVQQGSAAHREAIRQKAVHTQQQQQYVPAQPLPSQALQPQQNGRPQNGEDFASSPDDTMRDVDGEGSEEDSDADGDADEAGNGEDGNGAKVHKAAYVQPITPLQLPKIRPTLLLGPHESREIALNLVQEYAIAQGYVLVQSGSAKKKAKGEYLPEAEIVRVDLMCDRGGRCRHSGTGRRARTTHKLGCPTRAKLVCRKREAMKWFIEFRSEYHNHDLHPNNMDKIAAYRRWRRMQAGGPSTEPAIERRARNKKPRVLPPVPPPKFHHPGGLNVQAPANPTTPLHMASLKGQCKIIEILLNKGADINALDATGRTPLHCGVEGQRMDVVKVLVDRGADVTKLDSKGLSVLHLAVEKGMEDAVELFIDRGADPNK